MNNSVAIKNMPRMVTVGQLYAEIKAQDPNSCVTKFFIRNLVEDGKVLFRRSYSRVYINADSFYTFMNGTDF